MNDLADAELMIHLIAVTDDGAVAGDTWIPMPDGVDVSNIESTVANTFGEAVEPALDRHDSLGVIQVGWYFPGDRLEPFGLPANGNSALVIPCFVHPDGSSTSIYIANALAKQAFTDALGADNVRNVDGRSE
ncbi:MAG: hypothetical protein ACOYML_10780 [Microthrixaceae bacterium]